MDELPPLVVIKFVETPTRLQLRCVVFEDVKVAGTGEVPAPLACRLVLQSSGLLGSLPRAMPRMILQRRDTAFCTSSKTIDKVLMWKTWLTQRPTGDITPLVAAQISRTRILDDLWKQAPEGFEAVPGAHTPSCLHGLLGLGYGQCTSLACKLIASTSTKNSGKPLFSQRAKAKGTEDEVWSRRFSQPWSSTCRYWATCCDESQPEESPGEIVAADGTAFSKPGAASQQRQRDTC